MSGLSRTIAFLAFACACSTAMAQYVWQDEKGVRQYSDRPPPANTPASRIIKTPASTAKPTASEETSAPAQPSSPTLVERNADFQQRRTEAAEKEKRVADKEKQEAARKRSCEYAAKYQRELESGIRISQTTASGERAYMSDEEREKTIREVKRMQENCGAG